MIIVSGPAITTANLEVVSLAEVKAYTEQSSTSNDAILQTLLNGVHRALYERTGRVFKSTGTAWVVIMSGTGEQSLVLPQRPIDSATVTIEQGKITDSALTFTVSRTYASTEWYSDNVATLYTKLGSWPAGVHNLKVQYEAGYAVTPSPTEMPDDLKDAICQWVAVKLLRIQQKRWDKVQVVKQAESITYSDDEMPKAARAIFRHYEPLEVGIG